MLGVPGAKADFENSSYVYNLAWFTPGRAHTGARRVQDSELASVRTENLPQGKGNVGVKGSLATSTQFPGAETPHWGLLPSMKLPHTRQELYSTKGVAWLTQLAQGSPDQPFLDDARQLAYGRTYQAGRRYTERWNGGAVFGPSLPGNTKQGIWATARERLAFDIPLFGQAADTEGRSRTDSIKTVVLRDGEKVIETDKPRLVIPSIKGDYEISTTVTRSLADTSTGIETKWTFVHDGTPALPVQVVRFTPRLDAANSAPGGRTYVVPVTVQRNPGAAKADVESVTVQVSYDDGKHWKAVPVIGGKAFLHHPDSGHVSLRAKAVDTAGNTVEQTILRAYNLR